MVVGLYYFDVHRWYVSVARDQVIVEIRLLHRAIFDADALSECQTDSIDDAALRLCNHIVRLYRRATINGAPDVVDSDFAGISVDRDFEYCSNLRARVVDIGSAKS